MFDKNSRYARQPVYTVRTADGREVTAVAIPLPTRPVLAGFHRREAGERLDQIAGWHLKDPTKFWSLCDLANAPVPAALAARDLVAIPRRDG